MTSNASDRNIIILLICILLVPVALTLLFYFDGNPPIVPTPTPTPSATWTATVKPTLPSLTPSPTASLTATLEDASPTPELTSFIACVEGSYAVAHWADFMLYRNPNLTDPIVDIKTEAIQEWYPLHGQWLPVVAVLLVRKDTTYGTWEVTLGLGAPITGFIDPEILSDDCQY